MCSQGWDSHVQTHVREGCQPCSFPPLWSPRSTVWIGWRWGNGIKRARDCHLFQQNPTEAALRLLPTLHKSCCNEPATWRTNLCVSPESRFSGYVSSLSDKVWTLSKVRSSYCQEVFQNKCPKRQGWAHPCLCVSWPGVCHLKSIGQPNW